MAEDKTFKILIIVPAYNEESNIAEVINALKNKDLNWDILIVNDCSTDQTMAIIGSLNEIYLVNLCVNLGIGGAVQTGFIFANENHYDIAVQFDGDGQHNSSEIRKLINPIIKGETDAVIGSRFLEKAGFKSTRIRRLGIYFFQFINFIITKQKITDSTSGFRAYNKNCIEFLSKHYPSDYPEPESIVLLIKNGYKISEIATLMNERKHGVSSIRGLYNIFYMIKVILSILMTSIRPKLNY